MQEAKRAWMATSRLPRVSVVRERLAPSLPRNQPLATGRRAPDSALAFRSSGRSAEGRFTAA